jgi:hypothetical protein
MYIKRGKILPMRNGIWFVITVGDNRIVISNRTSHHNIFITDSCNGYKRVI